MKTIWNDNIFNCIRLVNRNLHGFFPLPEKAYALLYDMQSCLCSGNGLSERTAFRASSTMVIEKTLSLLGMGSSVRDLNQTGDIAVISVSENPYKIGKIYFKVFARGRV